MSFLEETIHWANYAESTDKIAFLKEFVNFLGNDELNCVRGILNRKRKKHFTGKGDAPTRTWKGPRLFTGCNTRAVRNPSIDVITPEASATVRNPSLYVVTPEAEKAQEPHWANDIPVEEFVAFDVEAAQRYIKYLNPKDNKMLQPYDLPPPKGDIIKEDEPRIPKAAYVAVVDASGKTLLNKTIQHLPGTFRVDYFSKQTANITFSSQRKNGTPFGEAVEEFKSLVKTKYIVACGGGNDFRYLEIPPIDYRQFDLQSFYLRPSKDNPEKMEPMSLRDIYFYHFKEDFQRGPHDATVDAKATMKIFREGYCKLNLNEDFDFSAAPNLKSLARKGLYYSEQTKTFISKCNCNPCNNVKV